jgi:hypothetical protein
MTLARALVSLPRSMLRAERALMVAREADIPFVIPGVCPYWAMDIYFQVVPPRGSRFGSGSARP